MIGGEDLESETTELLRRLIKNACVDDGMPASGYQVRWPSNSPRTDTYRRDTKDISRG